MFEYCVIKKRKCALSAKHKETYYCGHKTGENRILKMKKCPIKKVRLRLAEAAGRSG